MSDAFQRDRTSHSRRMALLKRAGLFSEDTQGARVGRAVTLDDLLSAYRLVHDVFVERGYIRPAAAGVRIRAFEADPGTATFVARTDAAMVGVTSVVADTPELGLPTDKAFRDVLDPLRQAGRKVCEGTNWLVAPSYRSSAVMSELMRCSFAHAQWAGCSDFIGTVSPGHAKFYALLGFEQISEVRSYSSEIDDPVVVVRLDLTSLNDRFAGVDAGLDDPEAFLKHYYIDANPYHRYVPTWQILSDRFFADATAVRLLVDDNSGFLASAGPDVLTALCARWPRELQSVVKSLPADRVNAP